MKALQPQLSTPDNGPLGKAGSLGPSFLNMTGGAASATPNGGLEALLSKPLSGGSMMAANGLPGTKLPIPALSSLSAYGKQGISSEVAGKSLLSQIMKDQ